MPHRRVAGERRRPARRPPPMVNSAAVHRRQAPPHGAGRGAELPWPWSLRRRTAATTTNSPSTAPTPTPAPARRRYCIPIPPPRPVPPERVRFPRGDRLTRASRLPEHEYEYVGPSESKSEWESRHEQQSDPRTKEEAHLFLEVDARQPISQHEYVGVEVETRDTSCGRARARQTAEGAVRMTRAVVVGIDQRAYASKVSRAAAAAIEFRSYPPRPVQSSPSEDSFPEVTDARLPISRARARIRRPVGRARAAE
ncbi:hypothetical protein C8F04DRAFT_1180954 [Mycena alexandri]|uniref:Uncharacterized protein n=1 Tax=Mycena alexandri TaxID=1745969 RepID=A0AAD6T0L1_9AGAR|nr:hypothetical protein C8F04DRAFT_1180954 [Mycena alexandri]